jgi:broad specificity phosphatase PhoE
VIAFVRHGETIVNREGRLQGRSDAPLSDVGAAQAAALAAHLATSPVKRVVSSPLQRARATAELIANVQGIDVECDERLIEIDYGEWDDLPLRDVPADAWTEWRSDSNFAPPGGERLTDVSARVQSFIGEMATDDLVVAVSHVSPIKAAVCVALDVGVHATWNMHLELASLTRIGFRPGGIPFLQTYNETVYG